MEKEALEIYEKLGNTEAQTDSLQHLALLFVEVKQVDAAEEVASQAIGLSSGRASERQHCQHHHILGHLHGLRGETEAAIHHFTAVFRIFSHPSTLQHRVTPLQCLLQLLLEAERFDEAQLYLESLKALIANEPYNLDNVLVRQAYIHYGQGRLGRAKSELSHIINTREKAGVLGDLLDDAKVFLQVLEVGTNNMVDTMEGATSHTTNLHSGGPSQYQMCDHHHTIGHIYGSSGKTELAISHHGTALGIAATLNLQDKQASILHCLGHLLEKERPEDAQVYFERLRLLTPNVPFRLDSKVAKYLFALFAVLCFFH